MIERQLLPSAVHSAHGRRGLFRPQHPHVHQLLQDELARGLEQTELWPRQGRVGLSMDTEDKKWKD